MNRATLCWFIHDSETARAVRPLVTAVGLVLSCFVIVMAVAG
jgi:hypothetical protein